MLKHLIVLANLTLVFGFFGERREKLTWDVTHTPGQCPITVRYGDKVFIYYKAYRKLEGVAGYEAETFEEYWAAPISKTKKEKIEENSMERSNNFDAAIDGPFPVHVRRGTWSLPSDKNYKMVEISRGLDVGIIGMCLGEKRALYVPKHLSLGKYKTDAKPIGAVKFEVEVMQVNPGLRPFEVFKDLDLNNDSNLSMDEVEKYLKQEFYNERNTGEDEFQRFNGEHRWVANRFRSEDINRDNKLSFEEFEVVGVEERRPVFNIKAFSYDKKKTDV